MKSSREKLFLKIKHPPLDFLVIDESAGGRGEEIFELSLADIREDEPSPF